MLKTKWSSYTYFFSGKYSKQLFVMYNVGEIYELVKIGGDKKYD